MLRPTRDQLPSLPAGSVSRTPLPAPATSLLSSLDDLLHGARQGDPDSTRAFIIAVAPLVLASARRMVGARHPAVEAIADAAIAHLLQVLPGYRDQCSINTLVCRVTTQRALLAKRQSQPRDLLKSIAPTVAASRFSAPDVLLDRDARLEAGGPLDDLIGLSKRQAVRRFIDELPEAQAEVVALYFVMGLPIEEIARSMGVPPASIQGRLRVAREALQARVAESERQVNLSKDWV